MPNLPDYSLVEHMLFKGFIPSKIEMGGVPIVLKTLNSTESELIELTRPMSGEEVDVYELAYIMAYSTFMFNQVNVLTDRDLYIPMLVDMYLEYPKGVLQKLLSKVKSLNHKGTETLYKIQAYTYGTESRQNWVAYQHLPLNDVRCTGIQGTENLGLSVHQKLWIHFNRYEDLASQIETDWDMAKFQASAHNPKGVQAIEAKDKVKRAEDRKQKQALYEGKNSSITSKGDYNEVRISNESAEDLKTQMMNELAGHKDFHDMVIAEHERKIRENYEREVRERHERFVKAREYQKTLQGNDSDKPLVFYDEHEVMGHVEADRMLRSEYLEEGHYQHEQMFDQKRNHLSRWGYIEEPSNRTKPEPLSGGSVIKDHYKEVSEDLLKPIGNKHGR